MRSGKPANVDEPDPAWPPGTIQIERIHGQDADIILQPRPTSDPNDPLNWVKWRKYLNYGLATFYALLSFAQVNASTPTWGPMEDELGFSAVLMYDLQTVQRGNGRIAKLRHRNDTYAIGCGMLALGSFMLIPFALKYGLRPIYIISSAAQMGIMIWAARTMTGGDWWGVNSLQCWVGSLSETMVQMTVADVFFVHQRGLMNSIYVWVSNLGSSLAPVAAGFITSSQGWRWVWWYMAIFFGILLIAFIFGFEESKFDWSKASLVRRPAPLEASTANDDLGGATAATQISSDPEKQAQATSSVDESSLSMAVEIDSSIPRKTYWQMLSIATTTPGPMMVFARHAYQPFEILCTIPGVAYMSMVYAVLQAWQTVQVTAISTYMLDAPYNFDSTQIGLMNLAPFIGNTLGSLICGPLSDWLILRMAKKNNGIYEPEMRIWIFVPFIPFQIAGTFWFGYALQDGQSWLAIAWAWGLCGFGSAPILSIALTYMTDAYNEVIGDALVALTFSRNVLSTIFVFIMTPWVDAVGVANLFNTLGAISLAVLLVAFVVIWQGKTWRFGCAKRYRYFAARQFDPRPIDQHT